MNDADRQLARRRSPRLSIAIAIFTVTMLALAWVLLQRESEPRFLHAGRGEFADLFTPPPGPKSASARREVEELLEIQRHRSDRDVAAARADRKTEVWQFAGALGLPPQQMRALRALADLTEQVEDDVRPYVREAKHRFTRLRPYEVDARLEPCIGDVRGDLSYPSGHATYGYVVAYLLSDMVPERRPQLMARAQEFARQRMVCGVHFPSDIEAGRRGGEWLAQKFLQDAGYRAAAAGATRELRAALGLIAAPPAD